MSCASLETVAAWVLGELSESEAEQFEEHYFGCSECFERARAMQRLVAELQRAVPPVLTPERRRQLEAERGPLMAVHVQPGETGTIYLGDTRPLGVWVMHGPLQDAAKVDMQGHNEAGELMFTLEDVPFDSNAGEVLLPCQLHYRGLMIGKRLYVELSTPEPAGRRKLGHYVLNHEFENP